MLSSSTHAVRGNTLRKIVPIIFAACLLGPTVCSAAGPALETPRRLEPRLSINALRVIGPLQGAMAQRILQQVRTVPFTSQHDSPLLLQGNTLAGLDAEQKQELKATYKAGYTVVLLDATMQHINALHAIVGEGVSYRSKDMGVVMAYALRRDNYTPTAMLLTTLDPSPLQTPSGDPDLTGREDEELALSRAVARTVTELTRVPQARTSVQPRDPSGQVNWLSAPQQTTTFSVTSPQGVYNTAINVYALYRCLDKTDHYAVTAQADWTATNAKWQGATSEGPNPSMYLDASNNLVVNWQDNRTYCSSGGAFAGYDDVCRYVNYPLSYQLTMAPLVENPVAQLNAAPAATQGQSTSYTSGFSFSIGGTVNVSAMGPGGGLSAGATWSNTTQTTVPPLIVDVSNTGNQGVEWNFKYCTTGLEPDPGTNCTGHVQMVKDVCQAQLGDDSGTNPQQGQTPVGKFSNAVQSAHWQQDSAARQGTTFDMEVTFQAQTANTIAHLNLNGYPDPIQGCNAFNCACVSVTKPDPVVKSVTFQIPFPSTTCTSGSRI
jgi:hypothetical protein